METIQYFGLSAADLSYVAKWIMALGSLIAWPAMLMALFGYNRRPSVGMSVDECVGFRYRCGDGSGCQGFHVLMHLAVWGDGGREKSRLLYIGECVWRDVSRHSNQLMEAEGVEIKNVSEQMKPNVPILVPPNSCLSVDIDFCTQINNPQAGSHEIDIILNYKILFIKRSLKKTLAVYLEQEVIKDLEDHHAQHANNTCAHFYYIRTNTKSNRGTWK